MQEIERAVRDRIGLDAASIGSTLLQRSIRLRMKSHGLKNSDDYHSLLQSSAAEWSELVESVVVTETWFFRDNEPFLALVHLVRERLSINHPTNFSATIEVAPQLKHIFSRKSPDVLKWDRRLSSFLERNMERLDVQSRTYCTNKQVPP